MGIFLFIIWNWGQTNIRSSSVLTDLVVVSISHLSMPHYLLACVCVNLGPFKTDIAYRASIKTFPYLDSYCGWNCNNHLIHYPLHYPLHRKCKKKILLKYGFYVFFLSKVEV